MVILYRSNAQSRTFEEQLRKHRVPYRVVGGQAFYDRKEVRDVVAYLRVFNNPQDEISLLRIINVPRRGIGEASVIKLAEAARNQGDSVLNFIRCPKLGATVGESAARRLESFERLVRDYRRRFKEPGLSYTLKSLLEDLDYEKELRKSSKSEKDFIRRWDNVMEVVNSLANYADEVKSPSLGDFLERVSLLTLEDKSETNAPENGLTLMTIHSAKGLEFPLVYLVGMEEDLIPHARSLADGREALKEERRLCYVALTRAQKHLILSRAEHRRKYGKQKRRTPSRFLKEIPEELMQVRKMLPGG